MLDNVIQLYNDAADSVECTFDLISRSGMSSVRADSSADADKPQSLIIKNTVTVCNKSNNRHLIRIEKNGVDAISGECFASSVHCVINRAPQETNVGIQEMLYMLADFIGDPLYIEDVLRGGN